MSPRSVIRYAEWTLGEETAEGAPRAIFHMECVTCGAESGRVDDDSQPVEDWAIQHTGRNLSHRQFRLTTEWFMRVDPTPNNPLHELERQQGAD